MRLIFTILLIGLLKADAQMVINASSPYRPFVSANLLLDDYTGAGAAFSLRKLDKDYTGSAIRVRRDSTGQTESDIGFVGNDLDTVALKNFIRSNNGFIVTWYDQSGNSRNATMATQASQPRIINSGTIERISGDLAIRFDGANDYLENNTNDFSVNNVSHYAISSRGNNADAIRTIYSTGILTIANGFGFFYADQPNFLNQNNLFQQIRNQNTPIISIGDYTNTINTNNLIFGVGTSSIDYTYFNGGNEKTVSHTRANVISTRRIVIGSRRSDVNTYTFYLNGTITELVFWNQNQLSNRTAIQNNINNYWSIY